MFRMSTDPRCFLQWFVLSLAYAAIAFFAYRYGLPQLIFKTDVTYMTSVIAVIFVATAAYLGFASWRYRLSWWEVTKESAAEAAADVGLATKASYIVTLFGLLGTVIGLQRQVDAMAAVTPDNIMPFLVQVSAALRTAFYATGCGIVASIGIIAMAANLEYFLERDDV
jgi:hypothetical protein